MSRVEFSRKIRRAIIERAAGKCEVCAAALKPGEGEVDHLLPCSLGGKAEISNGRLLCRVCHASKTAADIKQTRKADRQRDRHTSAMPPPKVKLRSAGFPKRQKPNRDQLPLPAHHTGHLMKRGELYRARHNPDSGD